MRQRFGHVAALLLFGLISGPPASAADIFEPMPNNLTWSQVVRSEHLHFVRIPNGKRNIVFAWGGIGDGDAKRLAAALDAGKPVDEIQLHSPGGLLTEGIKIGAMIREGKYGTRIPNGMRCVSACNFAFMGGVVRTIDPEGVFSVHMFTWSPEQLEADLKRPPKTVAEFNRGRRAFDIDERKVTAAIERANKESSDPPETMESFLRRVAIEEDIKDIQQESAKAAAIIAQYLVSMRLSLNFLTEFADIPNSAPRPLSREQLRKFNIVNE